MATSATPALMFDTPDLHLVGSMLNFAIIILQKLQFNLFMSWYRQNPIHNLQEYELGHILPDRFHISIQKFLKEKLNTVCENCHNN